MVGELQFFANVLFPGGIEGDKFWEEVGSHGSFDHVGIVEWLLAVIALHAAAGAFHVLAVVDKHLVQFLVFVADLLPVVDDSRPVDDGPVGEQFGHGEEPPVCFPSDIGDGILDEAEEVLKPSLLVSLVDALLAQSEFLQLPVVLLAHRSFSWEMYL